MQILGKRSKILLITVAIVMLVAVGISFAAWDSMSAVKASNGDISNYANAKVGDIIKFGQYYQTLEKDTNGEYIKTPIEWIVVDKDERTGQITVMSKYILAAGSYFGNYYYNNAETGSWGAHYDNNSTLTGVAYNQAYVDSTVRAYLNNLERSDLGGDSFDAVAGYKPSSIDSTYDKTVEGVFIKGTGLLSSVGFSNKSYFTYLNKSASAASKPGFFLKANDTNELYYQRPINSAEYQNRPATKGFFDEAFSYQEKSMIVPKVIAGYIGHRWPDMAHDLTTKSYVEGTVDKVWLPSATELNIANAQVVNNQSNDIWTNPSDEASSTTFDYFNELKGSALTNALKAKRTAFAENSFAANYSIPLYKKGTTTINMDIHTSMNSSDHYWTRSPVSYGYAHVRAVYNSGLFGNDGTYCSNFGVRPCLILKY